MNEFADLSSQFHFSQIYRQEKQKKISESIFIQDKQIQLSYQMKKACKHYERLLLVNYGFSPWIRYSDSIK